MRILPTERETIRARETMLVEDQRARASITMEENLLALPPQRSHVVSLPNELCLAGSLLLGLRRGFFRCRLLGGFLFGFLRGHEFLL